MNNRTSPATKEEREAMQLNESGIISIGKAADMLGQKDKVNNVATRFWRLHLLRLRTKSSSTNPK